MNVRTTDEEDVDLKEIRKQRSSRDKWIQFIVAVFAAIATALGAGNTYLLQEDQHLAGNGAELFTSPQAKALEDRLLRELNDKLGSAVTYDGARWKDIGDKVERQYQTVSTLAGAVQDLLKKCAEVQVRDQVMSQQIRDNRDLLLQHLGAMSNGWHGGRGQRIPSEDQE